MADTLNLPAFDIQLRAAPDGTPQLYDALRRRWLVVTPEEWVRQHFVHYLIERLGYPASRIANEVGLKLNGTQRRCDTLIYTDSLRPLAVIEYKRPSVQITAKVFDQIARYNSVLGARYLIVSNGIAHYCCRFTGEGYEYLRGIPAWRELL